jgi:DNA processing protein
MASDPIPWLILSAIPRLGPAGISTLIYHFKTPEAVLSASTKQLLEVSGIGPNLANAIAHHNHTQWAMDQIHKAEQSNINIVTLGDPHYPNHLRQIFAPPPILFYRGHINLCNAPTIAIVGSRSFTPYGRHIAYQLASELSQMGITIVSGMAIGTDTHAHRGALDQKGATAAVLGSSLDHPYPSQNLALFHQICHQGVAISEFLPNTKPEAHHFPRRNRIISGLSLGTVVVEAGQRSGALITAQFALEQNREVFAVPGPINSGRSIGTHQLIQQGAQLVLKTEDIMNEIQRYLPSSPLPHTSPSFPRAKLNNQEQQIWETLSPHHSTQANTLARQVNLSTAETLNILLSLELKGCVQQLPGLNFQRNT